MAVTENRRNLHIGEFLEKVVQSSRAYTGKGKVCDQIPALGGISRDKLAWLLSGTVKIDHEFDGDSTVTAVDPVSGAGTSTRSMAKTPVWD